MQEVPSKIVICVDDVHPEIGWGLPRDTPMKMMGDLHSKYGAKFVFFIPANYHNRYKIGEHRKWVDSIVNLGYIELAAHGYLHDSSDRSKFGECEFGEPLSRSSLESKMDLLVKEWKKCDHFPIGWRFPGWLCTQESADIVSEYFKYVAGHDVHNASISWGDKIKLFVGCDGINEDSISTYNGGVIMYQSHINGIWNKNVWSLGNYNRLDASLDFLTNEYPGIKFSTISELM